MTRRDRLSAALNPVFSSIGSQRTDLGGKDVAQVYTFYEAYLYAQVLLALDKGKLKLAAVPNAPVFRFRRAPGEIYTLPAVSHTAIISGNEKFEMHGDTKVRSKMHAPFELDVFIIPSAHADQCRKTRTRPSYRKVKLILESKYRRSGIGMGEAKEFLAICTGVRSGDCVDAIVSDGEITPDAKQLLVGCRPPLSPWTQVSPLKAHKYNVDALIAKLSLDVSSVL